VLNRYIGNQSAGLRTELRSVYIRWRIFDMPLKVGSGVFLDSGKIAQGYNELVSNDFKWAWGVSLFGSYFTDDFLGTMDIGFSHGETAFYMRLGHAF
jgi:hypothetical protein